MKLIFIINFFLFLKNNKLNKIIKKIGDWGLGIGDWGLGIGPNTQNPNPHPQIL